MGAADRPVAFEAVDMLQLPNRQGHLVPFAKCSEFEGPCISVLLAERRQLDNCCPILEVEQVGLEVNRWGNRRRHW